MLKLKDKYGKEHECSFMEMVVDFDVHRKYESNADYKAYFMIIGRSSAEDGEFIIQSGFDYYEIADAFIDLKKQLVESGLTYQECYLSKQNKEVATV